jgi:hyperosmotically inducible periplasmic protein
MLLDNILVNREVHMFSAFKKRNLGILVPILLFGLSEISIATTHKPAGSNKPLSPLAEKIQHEILMLPYNGVFDELGFTIDTSNTVVLTGRVVQPLLKSDAEAAVRQIQGISKVVNKIEVLPLSPFDDSIRLRTYRAIFSQPGFEKYAIQAISPIRIIVKDGNIALEGVVDSKMDKTEAEIAARSIPGAFSVTSNLKID